MKPSILFYGWVYSHHKDDNNTIIKDKIVVGPTCTEDGHTFAGRFNRYFYSHEEYKNPNDVYAIPKMVDDLYEL